MGSYECKDYGRAAQCIARRNRSSEDERFEFVYGCTVENLLRPTDLERSHECENIEKKGDYSRLPWRVRALFGFPKDRVILASK